MGDELRVELWDPREKRERWFRVVGIREARPDERVANLNDRDVSVAVFGTSDLAVVVEAADAGGRL